MTDLPPGWVETTVGRLVRAEYGKGLRAADRDATGSVPVYGSAGLAGFHSDALVTEPVVIVGRKGNAGACFVSVLPCWPIDTTYFLRVPDGVSPQFLGSQLRTRQLGSFDSSTAIPSLRRPDLESARVVLAPLNEQRRIVAAIEEQLSRLDAADASLAAATARALALRAGIVANALAGDWPVRELRDVTAAQVYGTSAKASVDPSGVPVLRMGNISDGKLDFSSLKYLPAAHPDVSKFDLEVGDILFNRTNSPELVGKSAVFESRERMTFASYLIRVRLTEECDPRWAVLVINGPSGRRYVAEVRTQQVGQANVNGTKLAAMPIPVPPLEEQRRIVARVEEQLLAIEALRAGIERAQRRSATLRRAVLEQAFKGKLVPQDPTDEPAATLLTRIRAERDTAGSTSKQRTATL